MEAGATSTHVITAFNVPVTSDRIVKGFTASNSVGTSSGAKINVIGGGVGGSVLTKIGTIS
jgi:hypothetical protein